MRAEAEVQMLEAVPENLSACLDAYLSVDRVVNLGSRRGSNHKLGMYVCMYVSKHPHSQQPTENVIEEMFLVCIFPNKYRSECR